MFELARQKWVGSSENKPYGQYLPNVSEGAAVAIVEAVGLGLAAGAIGTVALTFAEKAREEQWNGIRR